MNRADGNHFLLVLGMVIFHLLANINLNAIKNRSKIGVIVAHPDDETLWAGGTMLMNPQAEWSIFSLCRASDPDRSIKFFQALESLNAKGSIADFNDDAAQSPLNEAELEKEISEFLISNSFNILITHGLRGEYTRHLRHEETSRAVFTLWRNHVIHANQLWLFAYSDDNGAHLPEANSRADLIIDLPNDIWLEKKRIMTDIYGFSNESWETRTTPRKEAFWKFIATDRQMVRNESSCTI